MWCSDMQSHCTTPSEGVDNPLVSVKIGCFYINPNTRRGRRIYMAQMLTLILLPHAALLLQNCAIMADLSTALDFSRNLHSEMESNFLLGEAISAFQDEKLAALALLSTSAERDRLRFLRKSVATDLSVESLRPHAFPAERMQMLYEFRKNVLDLRETVTEAENHFRLYERINDRLFTHLAQRIKSTTSRVWRQQLASYELLKCAEEFTTVATLGVFQSLSQPASHHRILLRKHFELELKCFESFMQYVQADARLMEMDMKTFEALNQSVIQFEYLTANFSYNITDKTKFFEDTTTFMEIIRSIKKRLWTIIRESVDSEVWYARRTLAVGVIILALVLLVSPIFIMLLRHTVLAIQHFTLSLENSKQKLLHEKDKSDLLLSRMLPMPVIRQLRAQKSVPAEAFDAVTIFFSDIVGFTTICATSSPMEVINMLNMLYKLFDEKIMQYNVYKVETIGDAYMVVSGLPQRNGNKHASEIADMSLSLMRSLEGAKVPHKDSDLLKIRAGVNTGPCVAGVVGTTMPRYCLFGDSINTASRMESTGEPMKIHISTSTKRALDAIGGYEVQSRGFMDIAGKGMMETFWLISKIGSLEPSSPQCLMLHDYNQYTIEI